MKKNLLVLLAIAAASAPAFAMQRPASQKQIDGVCKAISTLASVKKSGFALDYKTCEGSEMYVNYDSVSNKSTINAIVNFQNKAGASIKNGCLVYLNADDSISARHKIVCTAL